MTWLLQRDRVGMKKLDRVVSTLKASTKEKRPTKEVTTLGRISKLKISTDGELSPDTSFHWQYAVATDL